MKQQLLDDIVRHLADHGLAAVSLRGIAGALGMSLNRLTHHFGSKAQLLATALRRATDIQEQVSVGWETVDPGISQADLLRKWWAWINESPENLALCRRGIEAAALDATVTGLAGEVRADQIGVWRTHIERRLLAAGVPPAESRTEASATKALFTGLVIDLMASGESDRDRLSVTLEVGLQRLEALVARYHGRDQASSVSMAAPSGSGSASSRAERSGIEMLTAASVGVDRAGGELRLGSPANLQYVHDPGVEIDLSWGHPDPTLLDHDAVHRACGDVLTHEGWQAMTYGFAAGPSAFRQALADHLPTLGERRPRLDEIFVTSGNSAALALVVSLCTEPGDVILVESPTYFLALRILGDLPVRVVGVRTDSDGLIPEAVADAVSQFAGNRGRRLLYTVPTHNNPTGRTMSEARRHELLAVADRHGLTIIEDDVYRELSWAPPCGAGLPRSLWSLASVDGPDVIRLGSFSKSLGPGLRVGYITASHQIIDRLATSGVLDSGGGVNHFAASVVGRMLADGSYVKVRDQAVHSYERRCAAFCAGLGSGSGPLRFVAPGGGYFVWVQVPHGVSSAEFASAARTEGVAVSNGTTFYPAGAPGDGQFVRLSFSLYEPEVLHTAGQRLARLSDRTTTSVATR